MKGTKQGYGTSRSRVRGARRLPAATTVVQETRSLQVIRSCGTGPRRRRQSRYPLWERYRWTTSLGMSVKPKAGEKQARIGDAAPEVGTGFGLDWEPWAVQKSSGVA